MDGQGSGANEESPLLGHTNGTKSGNRLHKHMTQNINRNWGDIVLLGCYVITGLLDSSAVFIWGAFVSMQTGVYEVQQRVLLLEQVLTHCHRKHCLPWLGPC